MGLNDFLSGSQNLSQSPARVVTELLGTSAGARASSRRDTVVLLSDPIAIHTENSSSYDTTPLVATGMHVLLVVAPAVIEYVPSGHGVHTLSDPADDVLLYVPALHIVGTVTTLGVPTRTADTDNPPAVKD